MPKNILMPALSPTMTEGNLTKWLVTEGQEVKAGTGCIDLMYDEEFFNNSYLLGGEDDEEIISIFISSN